MYYKDEMTYVVCSNGYASHLPCPPGTKTDKFPSYTAGYYYGSSDLCSINLVDVGYGPHSYIPPQRVSHENEIPNSYEVRNLQTDLTNVNIRVRYRENNSFIILDDYSIIVCFIVSIYSLLTL